MNNKIVRQDIKVSTTHVIVRVPATMSNVTELRVAKHPAMHLFEAFAKAVQRQ